MATDDKDDVRDNGADATENKAGEDEGSGESSEATHEGERAAAEEHLAKKERTEEAFGASKSGEQRTKDPAPVHGHTAHAVKHHAPNRKEYMVIFLVLFVLTVLEVAVAQVPGISKTLLGLALVSLAVTKAAFVGLYYMHLKHETNVLKLTVAIPLATPAVYAVVLIAEAAWRLTRQ
ncbi:MAG: cytochrome C oxidase subunit IV family protein [Polyangiaceae bacterium]|nr:cytochrome C oxidase subunit IV family protein [Polyangiaceae bacterium]NUQ77528.1 cytochrome C oxidase subunit IV family protein [Polyangiaceae bacterium]